MCCINKDISCSRTFFCAGYDCEIKLIKNPGLSDICWAKYILSYNDCCSTKRKKRFVFLIFHQNFLGNTSRANFCINYSSLLTLLLVLQIIYMENIFGLFHECINLCTNRSALKNELSFLLTSQSSHALANINVVINAAF